MMRDSRATLRQLCLTKAKNAHLAVRQCDIARGKKLYSEVDRRDLISLFFDPTIGQWSIGTSGSSPGIDQLCFYLSEYYLLQEGVWQNWDKLATVVLSHPRAADMDSDCRARMESLQIYRQISHGKPHHGLKDALQSLQQNVTTPVSSLTRAFHHMVTGIVYKNLRVEEKALHHLRMAEEMLSIDNEPFYAILNQELIGSTIYFLNQNRESYYRHAIEIYEQTEKQARDLANGIDFTDQAYNIGWVHAELREYSDALYHFHRGYDEAVHHDNNYDQAKHQYGIGYVKLMQGERQEARQKLLEALEIFMDLSYIKSAACLNLLAQVDAAGNLDMAINWAYSALDNLARADHPVQENHTYNTLANLHWKRGDYRKSIRYTIKCYIQRMQLGMPLV